MKAVGSESGKAAAARAKQRLCIVMGGHWSAQMGGAQYQAKCLLEAIGQHPELEIFYLAHRVPVLREHNGYRIIRVGSDRFPRARLLPHLPSLYSELKRLAPQVIYQRSLTPYTGTCAFYARRHGARFVFHVASDNDSHRIRYQGWSPDMIVRRVSRRIAEYGLRRAHAVVAQTSEQARSLQADYGVEVAAVVPNFHPAPRADHAVRSGEPLRVIWVANFKQVKNPEMFVALAEAFIERADVEFVMVGRPGKPSQYSTLHERMQRLPNLRYLGELALEETEREIAASDLLVNTSSHEGFPNTFIQAWLRGVPVLSYKVDPEGCLTRGGAGILAGSEARLRSALSEMLNDKCGVRDMGEAARAYARANHGFDQAQRLIELLLA